MSGSSWVWPIAATIGVLSIAWILKLVLTAISKMGDTGDGIDPLDKEIWHRYEEGDLTREEFERLRRKRAA
jgi:hypothetical protein